MFLVFALSQNSYMIPAVLVFFFPFLSLIKNPKFSRLDRPLSMSVLFEFNLLVVFLFTIQNNIYIRILYSMKNNFKKSRTVTMYIFKTRGWG